MTSSSDSKSFSLCLWRYLEQRRQFSLIRTKKLLGQWIEYLSTFLWQLQLSPLFLEGLKLFLGRLDQMLLSMLRPGPWCTTVVRLPLLLSSSIPSFYFPPKRDSRLVKRDSRLVWPVLFPYGLVASKEEVSNFLEKFHAKFNRSILHSMVW